MASITSDSGGRRRIQWVQGNARPCIRLGKVAMSKAEEVARRIEKILEARALNFSIDNPTIEWLNGLPADMHRKLSDKHLVPPRQQQSVLASTLKPFLDGYITGRSDVKPNTLIGLGQARRNLVAFFGESKQLEDITDADAEDYWRYLIRDEKTIVDGKAGVGLAINTARRLCGRAKQFFRFAVRKRLITSNPFAELESNVRSNPERRFFITRTMADAVSAACPDAEWRLIFALARYGGLRIPSELLALKWTDVDWDKNRLLVHSVKTEHIEGRATRLIPLFPEIRKALEEVFDELPEGAPLYVITRYRQPNANLRTQFHRIIDRAKLQPWPKLFHNLRSSRQTELAETLPAHVVCAWLGNTEDVARAHYLQVTDDHFTRALGSANATPKPGDANNAAQNAAQQSGEVAGSDGKSKGAEMQKHPGKAGVSHPSHDGAWPLSGQNNLAVSAEKPQIRTTGGAQSGAAGDDADLAELLAAWPSLSAANRRAILSIIRGG